MDLKKFEEVVTKSPEFKPNETLDQWEKKHEQIANSSAIQSLT